MLNYFGKKQLIHSNYELRIKKVGSPKNQNCYSTFTCFCSFGQVYIPAVFLFGLFLKRQLFWETKTAVEGF